MQIEPTAIPDILVLRPKRHGDARGFFSETWSRAAFAAAGLEQGMPPKQDRVLIVIRDVLEHMARIEEIDASAVQLRQHRIAGHEIDMTQRPGVDFDEADVIDRTAAEVDPKSVHLIQPAPKARILTGRREEDGRCFRSAFGWGQEIHALCCAPLNLWNTKAHEGKVQCRGIVGPPNPVVSTHRVRGQAAAARSMEVWLS